MNRDASLPLRLGPPFLATVVLFSLTALAFRSSLAPNQRHPLNDQTESSPPPFVSPKHSLWADSVLKTLSLERQIAQLLMPPVYSHADQINWEEAEEWAETFGIGGVICMQGDPQSQLERLARLQAKSTIPLLVSSDAEWGLGMRLKETRSWPRALTLGAANDEGLMESIGEQIGISLRAVGIHVNFAPVVDVNSNPANPVIGSRSFGSNVDRVSQMGAAYMRGLQKSGVLATAKHFPGHGDSDADSHLTLPSIMHDSGRLDSVELAPFKALSNQGLGAMMAAHLHIPAWCSTPGQPSTLSPQIIDSILRKELGFRGLVFTDAMTMKGFTSFTSTQTPHADALIAGNDVLLFPGEPALVISEIKDAISAGRLDSADIAAKCFRVLQTKSWCQVDEIPSGKFDRPEAERLHLESLGQALTVVKNNRKLPFNLTTRSATSLFVGFSEQTEDLFNLELNRIMEQGFEASGRAVSQEYFAEHGKQAFETLIESEPDWAIIHLGGTSHSVAKQYGISEETLNMLNWCAAFAAERNVPLAIALYGSPYLLERMSTSAALCNALVVAYQDDDRTVKAMAHAMTGAGPAGGHLPVAVGQFPEGFGLPWMGRIRLGFSPVPLKNKAKIDSIAHAAIDGGATPGCRVVVAHRGMIVHDGVYGTTDGVHPVKPSTVYDLASITKIASSTLALMLLEQAGQIDVNSPLSRYLPELTGKPIGDRLIRDVLSHRAGLKSWIPFYLEALKDSTAFSSHPSESHSAFVSNGCYMKPAWRDSIWKRIIESPVDPVPTHRYSDLGYYALQRIIENMSLQSLDEFVSQKVYEPAAWSSLTFNPLNKFDALDIAPTQVDDLFRNGTVRGTVHDPGAAMLGGVGGHAGLFGNAYDLARLMYMFRLGGTYAGHDWLDSEQVRTWTHRVDPQAKYRKASGFDRPDAEPNEGPTCNEASENSFGHSGFTGTLAWADPDADVIFVFLSNRTYPNEDNRKLIDWDVRTKIQHEVYVSLGLPSRFEKASIAVNP